MPRWNGLSRRAAGGFRPRGYPRRHRGDRRAAALARHHEELAALYAERVGTYARGAGGRTASWLRLMASRRRLQARGLAFGVLFGPLAAPAVDP